MPSISLVPQGDPTLLFTSAGMVPFKPYFLGEATPPSRRLASCQKCFRTSDIDAVGDNTHLTFFEMLGNFSIGDYFKEETISWAWEFVTQHLHLDPARLWITVFRDDDEAYDIWHEKIGIDRGRILRMDEETNFWGPAGDSGPCGPCSEIHYDFGPELGCHGSECQPGCDCGRYSELWNLVFTQYNQHQDGTRTPLTHPNIDTGMGLERITTVVQGYTSLYDTDIFQPLIRQVASLAAVPYGANKETDYPMRVIAEHSRGIAFLLADGVLPSNEGRGYVLRRIIRRAALMGQRIGIVAPFLAAITEQVVKQMQRSYPELGRREDFIKRVVTSEEERFGATLSSGIETLENIISRLETNVIAGQEAFMLYDTYGFPIELTREIAHGRGLELDERGFAAALEEQKNRARARHQFNFSADKTRWAREQAIGPTTFVGYERLEDTGTVLAIIQNDVPTDEVGPGDNAGIILDKTPFYAEKGGQVGDTGEISGPQGKFIVSDTSHLTPEIVIHWGKMAQGRLNVGQKISARLDASRRLDIARNHTATHLLHSALRQVLGKHVFQQGSLVSADRLRFDFTHLEPLTPSELDAVRRQVNQWVQQDETVSIRETSYQEALNEGVMALFEEAYGDMVRVVKIGNPPISAELCGGTHVKHTGEIGLFWIVSEEGIGAGVRRIEAKTGRGAEEFLESRLRLLEQAALALKTDPEAILPRLQELEKTHDDALHELTQLQRELALQEVDKLLNSVEEIEGVKVVAAQVPPLPPQIIREIADQLKERLGSVIIALGSTTSSGTQFITAVTQDLVARGYHAGNLAKLAAEATGGGGGGRPTLGQGGGPEKQRLHQALELVKKAARHK